MFSVTQLPRTERAQHDVRVAGRGGDRFEN